MDAPTPIGDPLSELLALAGEVKAWKTALASIVRDLTSVGHVDRQGAESVRADVQLYVAAQRDLAKVLVDVGRLDIDRRLAAIEVDKAARLQRVLAIACARLGVDVSEPRVIEAVQWGIAETEPSAAASLGGGGGRGGR
jgi:hypothetical protein